MDNENANEYRLLHAVCTVREVADMANVSYQTVVNWCWRGYLVYRRAGKTYIISRNSYDEFEENGRIARNG